MTGYGTWVDNRISTLFDLCFVSYVVSVDEEPFHTKLLPHPKRMKADAGAASRAARDIFKIGENILNQ
jgi:hypothetical protein